MRIGVTGSPGAGKSTFIGKLARALLAHGQRVAVIAVDPSSPITGGWGRRTDDACRRADTPPSSATR